MMLICRTVLFCFHVRKYICIHSFIPSFIYSFIYLSKLWEQYLTISQKTEQCGSSASSGKFHWSKSGALASSTTATWNILIKLIIIRPVIITAVCSSWPSLHTSVSMNMTVILMHDYEWRRLSGTEAVQLWVSECITRRFQRLEVWKEHRATDATSPGEFRQSQEVTTWGSVRRGRRARSFTSTLKASSLTFLMTPPTPEWPEAPEA